MRDYNLLAFDLGTGSGRGMLGVFDENGRLKRLEEVGRFPNYFVRVRDGIYWDYMAIYRGMLEVLGKCRQRGIALDCIGVDSWAQDYAYIGKDGEILGLPRSYRDPKSICGTDYEKTLGLDVADECRKSGSALGAIDTRYQLWYDRSNRKELFESAAYYVHIANLAVYLLTGVPSCDNSMNVIGCLGKYPEMTVSEETLKRIGVLDKLPPCFAPGTIIGDTGQAVEDETGYSRIPVACVEAHDTACAVTAIPDGGEYLWFSSGSFGMFGVVLKEPFINDALLAAGFSCTPMADGRACLMTGGGAGMYHIQQCMRVWADQGLKITYPELTEYACAHTSEAFFDFNVIPLGESDMPAAINRALVQNGFAPAETPQEFYVAFCNSLAEFVAEKFGRLESLLGRSFDRINIISGGSQADGVNRRIGEKTGKQIYAGLPEASAMGNLFSQRVAIGLCGYGERVVENVGAYNLTRRF